MSQIEVFFTLV